MSLILRQVDDTEPLSAHLALEALGNLLTPAQLDELLRQQGIVDLRIRKLPAAVCVVLCIAMNLFADAALPAVFQHMVRGLRWLWPQPRALHVTKGAICQARYRLGAGPLVALFRQLCQPLAQPSTADAFLAGYRLMALDGTILEVADTPANEHAFGRRHTPRGRSAWPQVLLVGLCECGTHAICDAGVWPHDADERQGARRLLRSVQPAMLVLWDRGLHSFELVSQTLARGAHFLGRLPAHVNPQPVTVLADGTQLVRLQPSAYQRRRAGEQQLVRLVRYTLDDPQRPGQHQEHRLITSLLEPAAEDLIVAYHTRWEFELTLDELLTHQRPARPLRSHKPVGVIQEIYALLIAHYLVRAVLVAAATAADLAPTRLSFLAALRVIRLAWSDFQRSAPVEHARLYAALLADVLAHRLPPRPNRLNPRVVKQKMSNYPVKRPHHRHWPQPTKPFRDAVVLLI